jgi:predicted kinase
VEWVKTTYANKRFPDHIRISSDYYIEEYAESQNKSYSEVFQEFIGEATKKANNDLREALKAKQDIVVDKTNLTEKSRKKILSQVPKEYRKVSVLMMHEPLTMINRMHMRINGLGDKTLSEKVLVEQFNRLTTREGDKTSDDNLPTAGEGFDELSVVMQVDRDIDEKALQSTMNILQPEQPKIIV